MQPLLLSERDLLGVDAAIVAEDDTAITVSLRIPKTTIRNNTSFLGAVIDAVVAPRPFQSQCLQIPVDTPRRNRQAVLRRCGVVAAIAAAAGLIVPWNHLTLTLRAAPFEAVSGVADHNQIHAGELLWVTWTHILRRPCYGNIERSWRRQSDGAIIYRERVPFIVPAVSETPSTFKTAIRQPEGIEPGKYTHESIAVLTCNNSDDRYVVTGPKVPFEIVP